MADAVIIVDCAVLAAEAKCALTPVAVAFVNAGRAVFAWVKLLGAELDLFLAKTT